MNTEKGLKLLHKVPFCILSKQIDLKGLLRHRYPMPKWNIFIKSPPSPVQANASQKNMTKGFVILQKDKLPA